MKRVDSESQGYFHHKLPQGNSVTVFMGLNSFFSVVPERFKATTLRVCCVLSF